MNVSSLRKFFLALAPVILIYSAGLSGDPAAPSVACAYDSAIDDQLRKLDWKKLPSKEEMQSLWDENKRRSSWNRGPFTTAGIVVKNTETTVPSHIVEGECLALREVQPGNNKILHFQAVNCGVEDKWGEGVYVAKADCSNPQVYRIANAVIDGHLHEVTLYVASFDANGLPNRFMYVPKNQSGTVLLHPGHGKAN